MFSPVKDGCKSQCVHVQQQSSLLLCLRYCDCVLPSHVNSCTSLCSVSAPSLTKDASGEAVV